MPNSFIEEMKWRGLLHDMTPELEDTLSANKVSGYIGFDPTADSLHVGNLVPMIVLRHFQRFGHRPIILVGGATGMIGDPSGKSKERKLLDENTLSHNIEKIKLQLSHFLDFNDSPSGAEMVNNYDWMKSINLMAFIRDVGKHITVNYMMAKDSVSKRLGAKGQAEGMSFTEFTYQLFQAYDFLHLYREKNCLLQMGGSDQWGNITTGTELIRRISGGKAHAMTCPLITKSDGSKFGKSEHGNVWLDTQKTSPYKFYQFWLNIDDKDAEEYIKIFTFLSKEDIKSLTQAHRENPQYRTLQKAIAQELTIMIHSKEDLDNAIKASEILFGKATKEDLESLNEATFKEVFEGVQSHTIPLSDIKNGLDMVEVLCSKTRFMKSNTEARRSLKEKAISVNKQKIIETYKITEQDLINDKYIVLQRGKKNFYMIEAV